MNELQESPDIGYAYPWVNDQGFTPDLQVVIVAESNDRTEESALHDDIDTSFVLASDDRVAEPPLPPEAADSIKKPPIDPPETTLSSPDELPEKEGGGHEPTFVALGEIASKDFSSPVDELYADLHPNLELVREKGYDLVINRGHTDQALVDEAVTRLTDGSAWHESEQDQYTERTYHVDDPEVPTLFTKTTIFALDPYRDLSGSINEMTMSQDVTAIVNSEQAQQAAWEQGFNGITYVAPLATVVSVELDSAVTVYPWQHGHLTPLADIWELEVPQEVAEDELSRVNAVAEDMHALLGANGVEAPDLGASQILIDENNTVVLVDVEEYTKFETPEAALAPAESAHFKDGQWHAGNDPIHFREDMPEMATIEQDAIGIARGTDDDNVDSPEFYTELQDDGTVVTLWNAVTKEAVVVNVANPADWESVVSQVFAKIPNVNRRGTILHVLGSDVELARSELFEVTVRKTVFLGGDTDIHLNTDTGTIEAYNTEGDQIYRYQPPSTRKAEQ